MKEELTNEVLEAMTECKLDCATCCANAVCRKYNWQDTMQSLATALLEERAKPKVFEDIPDNVLSAQVSWYQNSIFKRKEYTREPPKTRARILAEEIASAKISNEADLVDIIEQTIKNHFAELKEESWG